MGNVRPIPNAGRRKRIAVLRGTRNTTRSIQERIAELLDHLPRSVRSVAIVVFTTRTLIVVAVLIAMCSFTGIYYYNKLAMEIDSRLARNSLDQSVAIYSAPIRLSVGDHLTIDELTDHLRTAGYQQKPAGDENAAGSFEVDGDAIRVLPGATFSTQGGLNPFRIQDDKNGRVISLTDFSTGERLRSVEIPGELLTTVRDGDRRKKIAVQFSDVPDNLRNAILAAEDRRFFSHNGVDWRGTLRALKTDLDHGEFVQGGSTLTQQLIKNDFLSSDRTLSRKLKEAAMAVILESRLTKEEIFTIYCNDVYLGQSGTFAINGFGQAAQVYFDKDLGDLTLGETAFLAGLICAPNRYSAHKDQSRALDRRNTVLDAMVSIGAISPEAATAAKTETLQIKKHEIRNDSGKSYFIDYAQRFAEERYGPRSMSAQQSLTTTLDSRLQLAAYQAVSRQTEKLERVFSRSSRRGQEPEQVQGAMIALDPHTGEVLAMIGGRSYDESQLNRSTDSKRQPGSAFKPFVYATALSSRSYTPASMISDTPHTFTYDGGRSEYHPNNYHGGFSNRDVSLREALTRSLNVPAVELAMSVGLNNIADVAERCGLERPRVYPSMALGTSEVSPLELASAYTAFANGGIAVRPIPLKSVSRDEKGVPERLQASAVTVFSPQVAYLMTSLMQSVVDQGTAARLRSMGLKGAIAGKTGTTNDGWFVGFTPNLVCVAWIGFDDNQDLRMKASDAALPMWADFMKQALDLRPELGGESFTKPSGIVSVEIDPETGCLSTEGSTSHRPEIFIAGTEPQSSCSQELNAETGRDLTDGQGPRDVLESDTYQSSDYEQVELEICVETGLLASPACPSREKRKFELGKEPYETCRAELHTSNYAHPQEPQTRDRRTTTNDPAARTNPWLHSATLEKAQRPNQ